MPRRCRRPARHALAGAGLRYRAAGAHAAIAAGALLACPVPAAASVPLCGQPAALTATQQDHLLRFTAVVRDELAGSGHAVAIVARSGLDLRRFGLRYSHAGVSLKDSGNTPWSVRQLYYACDERRPRLFDQGLAGFLAGSDDPRLGYVSIVLLPHAAGAALARTALDTPTALSLLGGTYSANAHPFSLRYQNCNQWVIELLAAAGGAGPAGGGLRERAQQWLRERGYAPQPVDIGSHAVMFAAAFLPWFHLDDHPAEDRFALRLRISLPRSIEAFAHEQMPGAERIELCHDERRIVVHRGWTPVAEGCEPAAGDDVLALD